MALNLNYFQTATKYSRSAGEQPSSFTGRGLEFEELRRYIPGDDLRTIEWRATARSLLASAVRLLSNGCVGHVPEILDGDAPHHPRGCDAQAWGISELLRVWRVLEAPAPGAQGPSGRD